MSQPSRYALWAMLALPGIYLAVAWGSGRWSYGQSVSNSGEWSAQLLILTLAVTPLRRFIGATALTRFLLRRRRDLGVASFCYAALHLGIYIARKQEMALILSEAREIWLLAGWIAFAVFLALAITSNDYFVRILRQNWKRLHRSVYLAAFLVFVHWVLSAFDPLVAYLHVAILLGLQALRFSSGKRHNP